ncbi:hypothetical protein UlMin_044883 [Ulmus minor]
MKDIFNMDKTGLFYRLQLYYSLVTKQLEGKKQNKERLIIFICCNEDGSKKIPLWFIRKYAKLQCFKNVNLSSMNCEYHANKRAWMTGILFQEYVRQLDRKIDGRKVLLLVDNCPAHPKTIKGLKNIKLFFLEDKCFRCNESCNLGLDNICQASTIANCLQHCKIRSMDNVVLENLGQHSDDRGIQQLHILIKELKYCDTMDVEYFLNYPGENEATSELLNDEKLLRTSWEMIKKMNYNHIA